MAENDFVVEVDDRKKKGCLLLAALGASLGDLGFGVLLGDVLDDTYGDSLTHVTHSETTERGVFGEGFDTHGLGRNEENHRGITGLDVLGLLLELLTRTTIDLGEELLEFAGNVGSVAIQHGGVASMDLTRVVQDDDLSGEVFALSGGIVLGVTADVTTTDILDGDVLDVEADVVTRGGLLEGFVVHFDGLALSGDQVRSEGNDHAGLEDTSLDTADGHGTDTANLVDVLEGNSEGLVGGTLGGDDRVEGFDECGTLVPGQVGGSLNHVVTEPTGDGDEGDLLGVVTDLLEVSGDFLHDFVVTVLGPVDGFVVHLVDQDDHLLDTQGESEETMFTGLTVLRDTSFEFTLTGSDDENSYVGLRRSGNHVLDEIAVSGGIDDGEVVLFGLELPQGDIDGDTTFTFGLQFVEYPGVLERTLTEFLGLSLELFDGTLVDTTALVDQVTGGGRLAGIDVANHDQVNVSLILTHLYYY